MLSAVMFFGPIAQSFGTISITDRTDERLIRSCAFDGQSRQSCFLVSLGDRLASGLPLTIASTLSNSSFDFA